MNERILKRNEQGYKNMLAVARVLSAFSKNNATYYVDDVYLDFGQNWMWTTICRTGHMDCQVLCPRDWKLVVGANNIDELAAAVRSIQSDRFFND